MGGYYDVMYCGYKLNGGTCSYIMDGYYIEGKLMLPEVHKCIF